MAKPQQTGAHHDGIGKWRWDGASAELAIDVETESAVRDLDGTWSLQGFSVLLDGLSRSRLTRTLAIGHGPVSCAIGLSDGRRVQLVGQFNEDSLAEGVLLGGDAVETPMAQPGPILTAAFQPIISLSTGQTAGFEALARWSGAPDANDAAFEDPALATNMLIQSAEALSNWHQATGRRDLFVQVNLTARDLATPDVATLMETLIHGYNLPPGVLKVELTEQAALRDMDRALKTVLAIKDAGAGLVLDDFGSGHSSFAWLADMPADALKIDPDLTKRLGDQRTEHILEAITLLARRLDMVVTAEGVEDKAQIMKLRRLGFTYVQGFAFSQPLAYAEALGFLQSETA